MATAGLQELQKTLKGAAMRHSHGLEKPSQTLDVDESAPDILPESVIAVLKERAR